MSRLLAWWPLTKLFMKQFYAVINGHAKLFIFSQTETSHRGTAEGAGGPIAGGHLVKSPQQQWQHQQQQRFPIGFDGHQIQQSRGSAAGGFTGEGSFGNSLTALGDFSEDNFLAKKVRNGLMAKQI